MRPLRLELEGFTSFRNRAEASFEDADLFVLTGPTGAGKSSLIDAMVFALYGAVPRYDHRGLVAPVVNQRKMQARVRLDFEAGGREYAAVRVVRRLPSGGATTKEAVLERKTEGGRTETLARTADEVTRRVEEDVVGLGLEHFTKCVVLPQGRFATFLRAKPATRQDLLVQLLGLDLYNRVRAAAGERHRELDRRRLAIGERLDSDFARATPEAVAEARERVAALEELQELARSFRERMDELSEVRREARERLERARALADALARVRVPEGLVELADEVRRAGAAFREADQALERAAREREEAADARSALPERSELEAVRQRRRELAAVEDRSTSSTETLDGAERALERAREAEDEAEKRRAEAKAALETLPDGGELDRVRERRRELERVERRHERASAEAAAAADRSERAEDRARIAQAEAGAANRALAKLRADRSAADLARRLEVGEDCPVCLRPVEALPELDGPEDLSAAERALETAEAEAAEAQEDRRRRDVERAEAHAALGQRTAERARLRIALRDAPTLERAAALLDAIGEARERLERADAALGDARRARERRAEAHASARAVADADAERRRALAEALAQAPRASEVEARLAEIEEADRTLDGANRAEKARRRERGEALEAVRALESRDREAWRRCRAARDTVAELEPPSADDDDLAAFWERLDAWSRERLTERRDAARAADARLREIEDERGELADRTIAACGDRGLEIEEPETLATACAEALGDARRRLRAAEERCDERRRLAEELERVAGRGRVAKALGVHLSATGFGRWLQNQVLRLLVVGASERLLELSSGQYSLDLDARNEFLVVDRLNGDERRPARTLSGGETFLASLALALSLATEVASHRTAGGSKLEALFLDEGFGALDPETLDVAAASIERLGADRMVGLVTHVPELASRIPVQYQVAKTAAGSTVRRVEA